MCVVLAIRNLITYFRVFLLFTIRSFTKSPARAYVCTVHCVVLIRRSFVRKRTCVNECERSSLRWNVYEHKIHVHIDTNTDWCIHFANIIFFANDRVDENVCKPLCSFVCGRMYLKQFDSSTECYCILHLPILSFDYVSVSVTLTYIDI